MPPITQISKGVFGVAPAKINDYKDTVAGGYVSAFTKARADQWELELEQAKTRVKDEQARYLLELEAYQDRLRSLDKEEADALTRAALFNADAKAAADKFKADADLKANIEQEKIKAGIKKAAAEVTYVPKAGIKGQSSSTSFGTGGGRGKTGIPEADYTPDRPERDALGVIQSQGTSADKVASALASFQSGTLAGRNKPGQGTALRASVVQAAIDERKDKLGGDAFEAEAIDQIQAEFEAAGGQNLLDSWADVQDKVSSAGAGAGGITRTSASTTIETGREARKKYPGLDTQPPPIVGTEYTAPTVDKDAIRANFQRLRENLGRAPTAKEMDYVYEARRGMQRNFGPTTSPEETPFEQRKALDFLLRRDLRDTPDNLERARLAEFLKRAAGTTSPAIPAEALMDSQLPAVDVVAGQREASAAIPSSSPTVERGVPPEVLAELASIKGLSPEQVKKLAEIPTAPSSGGPDFGFRTTPPTARSAVDSIAAPSPNADARQAFIDSVKASGELQPKPEGQLIVSPSDMPSPPRPAEAPMMPSQKLPEKAVGSFRPTDPLAEKAQTFNQRVIGLGMDLARQPEKLKRILKTKEAITASKLLELNKGELKPTFNEIKNLYSDRGQEYENMLVYLIAISQTKKDREKYPIGR